MTYAYHNGDRLLEFCRARRHVAKRGHQQTYRSCSDWLARTKAKSALNPEILCRRFTPIRGFLVFDGLTLIERAKACPFDCRNMNEHIFAATLGPNESITFRRIEAFQGTDWH
jgi:hypothetical protein